MQDWATETGADTFNVEQASAWAVENNLYQKPPISAKQQCMQDMRRVLQQLTHVDPQGNKVRTMHAIRGYKGEQMTLWVDVRIAKPDLAKEAFTQSHAGIGNDVKRHSIEKQSYDLNNPYGATLPDYNYDFTQLAEDAKLSGEYDDSYDDDDFDEDLD
jgi:hypothetical protein